MEEEGTLKCPFDYELEKYQEQTLPDFILRKVQDVVDAGKTTFMTDAGTGESIEFPEFEELSRKVACSMYKRGMRKGDTVIYMTSQMLKLHVFFVGVWRANGIVRASYPEDLGSALEQRVEESRAGWILCDPETAEVCLEVAENMYWDVEVFCTEPFEGCSPFSELFDDEGEELPELEVSPDDSALVLATSGTTGNSKGAVHTHRNVVHSIIATNTIAFNSGKPNLLVSKATHITGSLFPLTLLCSGKQAIVLSKINKKSIFEAVDQYKPGMIWAFPTFLLMLVNDPEAADYDFSSLELAATGGAQVTPTMELTMTKLPSCKALVNCYGLTEIVPISSEFDVADDSNIKIADIPPFSVGKVSAGVLLQIRDPETGEILKTNQRGEICVKSDAMFSHYLNNPEASASAFIDGFFRTGDLGYYDENQFLFLVDRIKEIFKYWNNHISPTEVEDIVNQHEAVGEVCVVGIEDPEGGGFYPRAYVTLVNTECTKEEIIQFAHERLPNYKHLRGGLFIVPELPKGKTGKIQRSLVSQMTLPEEEENEVNEAEENNQEEAAAEEVENAEDGENENENNQDQESDTVVENNEVENGDKEEKNDDTEAETTQDDETEQNQEEEENAEKDESENQAANDEKEEETEIAPVEVENEEEGTEENGEQPEEDSKEEKPDEGETKEEKKDDE